MKRAILLFFFLSMWLSNYAQRNSSTVTETRNSTPSTANNTTTNKPATKNVWQRIASIAAKDSTNKKDSIKETSQTMTGTTDRISFIIGAGASYITDRLYDNPAVNPTNNAVMIQDATRLKMNLTFGISYTPFTWDITTTKIDYVNNDTVETKSVEHVTKGRTFSLFINPIAFNKVTETQSFFNMLDFGVGFGYKFAGGLVLLGTAEFFSVRQPRNWFIDQFKGVNKPYEIGGSPQKTIDINDNNIFTYKQVITLGFKACYNFDVVKNFLSRSQSLLSSNSSSNTTPSQKSNTSTQPIDSTNRKLPTDSTINKQPSRQ